MAYSQDPQIEHLLWRAGFGARSDELETYRALPTNSAVAQLLNFQEIPDDVDTHINQPGYVLTTVAGGRPFSPSSNIVDARQRWVFRMIHSDRPLQEKMTLFWHNHFATGYTKLAGLLGATEATRYMAAKRSEDPAGVQGQIEMLRENALGNFRDILVKIAQDTAMLYWLDGYTNTKAKPQENFGREVMELFTMGVGHYTEPDVYAAARVFSGWNVTGRNGTNDPSQYLRFAYIANQHETSAKTFSFPIYADGNPTIPARAASDGMQDGLDFINGLARNPNTAKYLGKKLYRFFVSETADVSDRWLNAISNVYFESGYDMRSVMRAVLMSPEFWDENLYFTRYAWPSEFVVRSIKDIGWKGFSVNDSLTPMGNMGQNLYDPPDVSGWDLGESWFSTGAMLARMNFASTLAGNQRFNLATDAKPASKTPDALLAYVLDALKTPTLDRLVVNDLMDYLRATGPWTGSTAQLQSKVAGLVHLVAGTPEYQFV